MQLTPAQKSAIAAHIAANTNLATLPDGPTFVINTKVASHDPTEQKAIADWYNAQAKANDNQPFANRLVWNPFVTISQINSAIVWATDPAGATDAERTNNWLRWQSMTWAGGGRDAQGKESTALDMTDAQVRKGVTKVWGDVPDANAFAIGGNGCGQKIGTNMELVLSNAVTGSTAGGAMVNAHPPQKDAGGKTVVGQLLTQLDVEASLFPNG